MGRLQYQQRATESVKVTMRECKFGAVSLCSVVVVAGADIGGSSNARSIRAPP